MADEDEAAMMGFPLFEGFTESGARDVLASGEVVELGPGVMLFEEGAVADSVVLVLEGEVEIFVERNGGELVLTRMGAGVMIGELAVLCEMPRSASVRVVSEARLLKWDPVGFRRLLLRDAALAKGVFGAALKMMVEKERALIAELAEKGS